MNPINSLSSRRHFLKTSSTALAGGVLAPGFAIGKGKEVKNKSGDTQFTPNSDTLKIALVGCGGRGSGACADALNADSNTMLTAMADIYDDRLQNSFNSLKAQFGDRIRVTPETRFVGWESYKQAIDSGVDVVLLAAPPGFRPVHLNYAIQKGKHVFAEKPMGVDAPGVRSVLASAEEARKKSLSLVTGYCWRYDNAKRETFKRIHDGLIGDIRTVYTTYNTGSINKHDVWNRQNTKSHMDWMMRRWYFFTWLSGDHIVEQACHSIDKMAWTMRDQPPVSAIAHGGRQVRTDPEYGHIFDHFAVVYDYPNGVKAFHFCRQQDKCAGGTIEQISGTKGICNIQGGNHRITGESNWRWEGKNNDKFLAEHEELFAAIRSGKPRNDGVWAAHSTMLAIMGRMAAYTGQVITWEEALNSKEDLMPPRLGWDLEIPVPPVALPGKTRFV